VKYIYEYMDFRHEKENFVIARRVKIVDQAFLNEKLTITLTESTADPGNHCEVIV
jgi:hypothetical protein